MLRTPNWLSRLERVFGWLSIPNIGVIIVTLQALGFIFVKIDPVWIERLALVPELVKQGEVWRLVTFLALPLSLSPIWMLFVLWFLYYILAAIESEWGSFKTTLYVLTSVLITIAYAFIFDIPVAEISHFESSLFLAAAALFPEMEISLFLILPIKMKWLGYLTLAFVGWDLFRTDWIGRGYILAIYSNYLLFFGPALFASVQQALRRRKFRNQFRS